ncbi:hypothetical protein B0H13DRAFT_2660611 [Mycena leptocephala]|nr:hypothetical protein B0H13DRAFT_2660611 [Mycena leptocephala]
MSHWLDWYPSRNDSEDLEIQSESNNVHISELLAYDQKQPLMGAYNTAAVAMLEGRPYSSSWDDLLDSMDVDAIYKLGLRSQPMFDVVMGYVRKRGPDSCHLDELRTGGASDYLSKLPVDLFPIIFAHTKLKSRINLSGTSRKFRALCARELQASVNRLLCQFHLSHITFRFMQTLTRAIICRSTLGYLFDYNCTPTNMEITVPINTYAAVLRFFSVATDYAAYPSDSFGKSSGVLHSTTLRHPSSTKSIVIFCSITDSGLDPIPYSNFSHLFGGVTHYGLWLAYPETATSSISFPNRSTISFVHPGSEYRISHFLRTIPHPARRLMPDASISFFPHIHLVRPPVPAQCIHLDRLWPGRWMLDRVLKERSDPQPRITQDRVTTTTADGRPDCLDSLRRLR